MNDGFIPYGRQIVAEGDIEAVADVLRGDWLTTGPVVRRFEDSFAATVGADHAVAVSSGTAALHLAALACGIGPGDEVIVPALTFAASANCVRYAGGTVVFADVRPDTLTIDPDHVQSLITPRTRAIVAVDYAGIPADLDPLMALAAQHNLVVIEDACHALGAEYRGRRVGSIAHLSVFSFHPVKHITTGEGGMVTSNDSELAARVRRLRNHGLDSDARTRELAGTWTYDMVELGFNYRLPDINCALGLAQLERLDSWVSRRRELATRYETMLSGVPGLGTLEVPSDRASSWHLFPVRVAGSTSTDTRRAVFDQLRSDGIGVNVHYLPVYWHSYYRDLGYRRGLCPVTEAAYEQLLSLPMWPGLSDEDQDRVVGLLTAAVAHATHG